MLNQVLTFNNALDTSIEASLPNHKRTNIFNLLRDREIRKPKLNSSTAISKCADLYESIKQSLKRIDYGSVDYIDGVRRYKTEVNEQESSKIQEMIREVGKAGDRCLQLQKFGAENLSIKFNENQELIYSYRVFSSKESESQILKQTYIDASQSFNINVLQTIEAILKARDLSKRHFQKTLTQIYHSSHQSVNNAYQRRIYLIQDLMNCVFTEVFKEQITLAGQKKEWENRSDSVIDSLTSYVYFCEEKEKMVLQAMTSRPITISSLNQRVAKEMIIALSIICTGLAIFKYFMEQLEKFRLES